MKFAPSGTFGGILVLGATGFEAETEPFTTPTGHNIRKWVGELYTGPVVYDYINPTARPESTLEYDGAPTAEFRSLWEDYKKNKLPALGVKAILVTGHLATKVVLNGADLYKSANYVFEMGAHKVVPTYGVRELNIPVRTDMDENDWFLFEREFHANQFWFKSAVCKVSRLVSGYSEREELYFVDHNPAVIEEYLHLALSAKEFCYDIETKGIKDHTLTSLGIGLDSYSALAVSPDSPKFGDVKAVIKKLSEDESVLKIGQNLMGFDIPVMWYDHGINYKGACWDTLQIFKFLYPELPAGLKDQARIYLYRNPWKGFYHTTGERLRQYNAEDVVATYRIFKGQMEELAAFGQLEHARKYLVNRQQYAWHIMRRGIKFNLSKQADFREQLMPVSDEIHRQLSMAAEPFFDKAAITLKIRDPKADVLVTNLDPSGIKTRKEVDAYLQTKGFTKSQMKEYYLSTKSDRTKYGLEPGKIYKKAYSKQVVMVERAFNANSPVQLKQVFANMKVKLPKSKKSDKTWGESSGKKSLLKLLREHKRPLTQEQRAFVVKLMEFRDVSKYISTYLKAKVDPDGRWRCTFNLNGTGTGRASSSQSVKKTGGNNQNIPRTAFREKSLQARYKNFSFKSCFLPDAGYELFQFDQATAEMVIVAYLAKCEKMIKMLNNGEDVHVYFISEATGEDVGAFKESDPERYKRLRQLGKGGNFSGSYGTGPKTLADMFMLQGVDVSVDEAAFILEKRRQIFPEIYEIFQGGVMRQLQSTRTLVTPFGRKRKFLSVLNDNTYREAFAYVPQSTVAYISNEMIERIEKTHPAGAHVLQQGHDAVMGQLIKGNRDFFKQWFFNESNLIKLKIHDYEVVMKWAGGFGATWGEIE